MEISGFSIVRLEMKFKKRKGVDPSAATLADRCPMFGISHRDFLEDSGD